MYLIKIYSFAFAILLNCVLVSYLKADENIFKKSLKYLPENKQEKVLQIYNLFRIIDYRGVFKELQKLDASSDSVEIDSLVEEYFKQMDLNTRPDTPDRNEYKEEIMKRVEYCNQHFSTLLFWDSWDMRAEAVLKIGIPDQNYQMDTLCWTDRKKTVVDSIEKCWVYYLEWVRNNINLAYQDDDGDGVPDRSVPHPTNFRDYFTISEALIKQQEIIDRHIKSKTKPEVYTAEGIEKIIKDVGLNVSTFKNLNNTYTTYVSVGVPVNKIETEGDTANFKCSVIIYDEKNNPVIEDSAIFTIPSQLLKIKKAWIPIYSFYNLPPGNKTITAKVENKKNAAILLTKHQISSYKSLSDVLLSETPPKGGTVITKQQGIQRNGLVVKENPYSTFTNSDTIHAYFEINNLRPDSTKNYPYSVECFLRPLPKGKKKGEVELGPLITIGETLPDTLEGEILKQTDFSKSGDKWPFIRLYSEKKVAVDSTDYIEKAIKIPDYVEEGAYVLQFVVRDKTNVPKVSWRVLNLEK